MFSEENNLNENINRLVLKAGSSYLCINEYCPRADWVECEEGEICKCKEDGVIKGWIIAHPEKYFVEI